MPFGAFFVCGESVFSCCTIGRMETYFLIMAFVLGTLIGSFLNVVLYRFHTGRSLNGRSHCMSCGETLTWYELFPIVSYLFLRARCKFCGAYIPLRYLLVELLTGAVFLLMFVLFRENLILFGFFSIFSVFLILITVYDIRHTIIPDELTLALLGLAVFKILFLPNGTLEIASISSILFSLLAGAGASFFFYLLWKVSEGRWLGLGDAKLAFPLGMIAGTGAVSMVVLSFWIGAGISIALLGVKKIMESGTTSLRFPMGRLTIHSEVPFAPFLILGFLLATLFHADIFQITAYLLPLG